MLSHWGVSVFWAKHDLQQQTLNFKILEKNFNCCSRILMIKSIFKNYKDQINKIVLLQLLFKHFNWIHDTRDFKFFLQLLYLIRTGKKCGIIMSDLILSKMLDKPKNVELLNNT